MKKTYTILNVTHAAISPEKGSIGWSLRDELGRERKVNGITTLDKDNHIEAVRSIYSREAPLVEELLLHFEGDTFTIDFTAYNKAQGYINREIYADLQKCQHFSCMALRAGKALAVAGVLAVLWLGWTFYTSVHEFAHQQPLKHHELP